MISPQGTVWLGHVPWDTSYRHVYYEGMMDKSLILSSFMTLRTDNYTYIREDTDIRVPYNADSIYGINFCMYQNDDMWFCSFVNSITYVNNGTSLLHLQEDIWHTWGGLMVWKTCFVAREHAMQDELGQWRCAEPAIELENQVIESVNFGEAFGETIILGVNAVPHLKNGGNDYFNQHTEDDFDGSDAVAGGYYGSIFSGLKYYGFTRSDAGDLTRFLENLNMCGAADSVGAMFMMPSLMVSVSGRHEVVGGMPFVEATISAPQVLGGNYSPRNKKCLTYPYAYTAFTDYTGGTMDVKYEDCNSWGEITYRLMQGVDPSSIMYVILSDYQGNSVDENTLFPLGQNTQCSWVYDTFANWSAQNSSSLNAKANANNITVLTGVAMFAAGLGLTASGVGAEIGIPAIATGASALSGISTAVSGAVANEQMYADIEAQSKHPNHIVGGSGSSALQGVDRNYGGFVRVALQLESARRLDWFFDVYGYQMDQVRLPNVTSRPSWNYLKTVGACMGGNIPADRLAVMNQSLDAGMTFWHTVSVGDYGQDNRL